MSLRIPTMAEILVVAQSRGMRSRAPDLWRGAKLLMPMQEGGGDRAFDVSGNRNHGTLTNMDPATDRVVTERGRALLFVSGEAAYVSASAVPSTSNVCTFCTWIYADDYSTLPRRSGVIANNSVDSRGWSIWLNNGAGDRRVMFAGYDSAGGLQFVVQPAEVLVDGKWYFLAMTLGGASGTGFINGIDSGSDAYATLATADDLRIGDGCRGVHYDGKIANPLLYGRPLAPSEIQQLYADPWAMYTLRPTQVRGGGIAAPLSLPDYPDVENASPFEQDEGAFLVAATGGVPEDYQYSILSQDCDTDVLLVTDEGGSPSPDCTGVYVEAGTYGGQKYYARTTGTYYIWWYGDTSTWILSDELGGEGTVYWYNPAVVEGNYDSDGHGTAAVALAEPFAIGADTGQGTFADPTGLAVGQVWTITVQVDDGVDSDTGIVTLTLTSGMFAVLFQRANLGASLFNGTLLGS